MRETVTRKELGDYKKNNISHVYNNNFSIPFSFFPSLGFFWNIVTSNIPAIALCNRPREQTTGTLQKHPTTQTVAYSIWSHIPADCLSSKEGRTPGHAPIGQQRCYT